MRARVSEIWIHPIKSCRGIPVEHARLERRGLADDRRYMLVDPSGRFVTQREEHRLALVAVTLQPDTLELAAPDLPTLAVPRRPARGERTTVSVWRSECDALVEPQGSAWFSRLLGRPLRLVYMPDDVERGVSPARARPGDIVSFADGYPLLLISQASLDDLNARLETPIEIRRFRPNIVISGCAPFAEDEPARLRIGAVELRNVKPCARCVITTVDPETATAGKEPLRTLAAYRKTDDGVLFGVNLVHEGVGEIRVGDPVESCPA